MKERTTHALAEKLTASVEKLALVCPATVKDLISVRNVETYRRDIRISKQWGNADGPAALANYRAPTTSAIRDEVIMQKQPDGQTDPDTNARRSVLKWAAVTAVAACAFGVDVKSLKLPQAFAQSGVDLGSGDIGVLNYAYALEQLEAAFYTQVIATPYGGMGSYERALLREIRDHEAAHRAFFAKALGRNRIPDLTPNFSAVNFSDRTSVLSTASTFEDLGVAAYNGGGAAIQSPRILAAAGSIVSVEARHAETIRHLVGTPGVVDEQGLDRALLPSQVLPQAAPFIATPVTASQLP